MFGGPHRIDEAKTARAGWGDTNKWKNAARETRLACHRKGVFVDTKTIRIKSLETVGVVRDNAVVSMGGCNTICYKAALKVVWYEARKTVWAFCDREERHVAPLEGGTDAA
jgi:hypothetical protein